MPKSLITFFCDGPIKDTQSPKLLLKKKAKAWVLNFALLLKLLESPHN
jgi:hypothetical protein